MLQYAADRGQGAAAYVLAGELARDREAPAEAVREWLERSSKLGYARADDALRSGRPPLEREVVGAADPALLTAWIMESARRDDGAELRRLGRAASTVRDQFGRTALAHAASVGARSAASALLELGAEVGAADKEGTTALMIAAERGDDALMTLLLAHGADAKATDREQRTALFYAAWANHSDAVATLQHAGAILEARDSRGYNALDAATAWVRSRAPSSSGISGCVATR